MERALTLKANYFAEHFGYDIHIILTDGKGKEPYYPLHPSITLHQLSINYDEMYGRSLLKRISGYSKKQRLYKKRLNECLCEIRPDITVSLLRREINFICDMKDGSVKLGEIHFNKSNYREFTDNRLPGFVQRMVKQYWMRQLIRQLRKVRYFVVLSNEDSQPASFPPRPTVGRHAKTGDCRRKVYAAERIRPPRECLAHRQPETSGLDAVDLRGRYARATPTAGG